MEATLARVQKARKPAEAKRLLLEAIIETSKKLKKREAQRPVIVAITTEGPELSDRYYDLVLAPLKDSGAAIHAIVVIMLTNHYIWINESRARAGGGEQDHLLKLTHSINGVRNTAKNQLARLDGGRRDFKTDCFAAELVAQFGDWNIF